MTADLLRPHRNCYKLPRWNNCSINKSLYLLLVRIWNASIIREKPWMELTCNRVIIRSNGVVDDLLLSVVSTASTFFLHSLLPISAGGGAKKEKPTSKSLHQQREILDEYNSAQCVASINRFEPKHTTLSWRLWTGDLWEHQRGAPCNGRPFQVVWSDGKGAV